MSVLKGAWVSVLGGRGLLRRRPKWALYAQGSQLIEQVRKPLPVGVSRTPQFVNGKPQLSLGGFAGGLSRWPI